MTDIPFLPGGIVPPGGPDPDLIPALIEKGELVGAPRSVRAWLASGLSLEEWIRRREQGDADGDAG